MDVHSRQKICGNIYKNVNIIIDYFGLVDSDIFDRSSDLDKVLNGMQLTKENTPLKIDEIEEYCIRQSKQLTIAAKRKYMDEACVIRYVGIDNEIEIVICRLFVMIGLNYLDGHKHSLKENFELICKLITVIKNNRSFFKIQSVSVEKSNCIYCENLYQLFGCLERARIGGIVTGNESDEKLLDSIQSSMNYLKADIAYIIEETMERGDDIDGNDIYMGELILKGKYVPYLLEEVDVFKNLSLINDELFNVFIQYITEGFLNDLIEGKSLKVIGGVNKNE